VHKQCNPWSININDMGGYYGGDGVDCGRLNCDTV
jgi:hypothetical protein